MLRGVTTVFTATTLGRVPGVYQSGVEVRFFGCRWDGGGDRRGDLLRVDNRLRECELDLGGLRGMLDGADRMSGIIADELICSVDDHLRRIRTVHMQAPAVLALPFRVLMRGETVVPALSVPIVHMLAKHDDLRAINGLRLVELCQKSVGGRATGTALRSEQFHQDRRAV